MTHKKDRTARGHFNLLMFNLLTVAATAATSPLASASDYYFTVPGTTNIVGKVIGDGGDYKLVRQEDIAWLREAFAERNAMAAWGGVTRDSNTVETLVKGRTFGGPGNEWYDPEVEVEEMSTPRSSIDRALSDIGLTNITINTTNLPSRGLVSLDRITKLYGTARSARRLVYVVDPTFEPGTLQMRREETSVLWGHGWCEDTDHDGSLDDDEWKFNPSIARHHEVVTNTSSAFYEASSSDGNGSESAVGAGPPPPYFAHDSEERLMYTHAESGVSTWNTVWEPIGNMSVQLEIKQPCATDAWLRGNASPDRFVKSISAWGLVEIDIDNSSAGAALVNLGQPVFVGASSDGLVWRLTVNRKDLVDRAASLAGTRNTSWATAASANPAPMPINGWRGQEVEWHYSVGPYGGWYWDDLKEESNSEHESRHLKAEMAEVALVIDIKPATRLGEW